MLAARPAAAKLHGDLSGISKLSQQLAQATAGWRVGLGRSDRVAQAATGTAGSRTWPALDLKRQCPGTAGAGQQGPAPVGRLA
jgi:hypothetical protein